MIKKITGLVGYPLGHTISPAMHNAAFRALKLDLEYEPFEVAPDELAQALNGFRALHFAGFNVTIPHKEAVVPLLDEVTELARLIGAVNTVVNQEGRLVGYNTDGAGFVESLKEDADFSPRGKTAVVLGAGGASRAVTIMLAEAGAAAITLSDLVSEKARELADYAAAHFDTLVTAVAADSVLLKNEIEQADLVVNTTPLGMRPKIEQNPLPPETKLDKKTLVYDLVYNPRETVLLKQARAAGARTCSGLGMLVRQGALAFTLWTGQEAPVTIMRQAAEQALQVS